MCLDPLSQTVRKEEKQTNKKKQKSKLTDVEVGRRPHLSVFGNDVNDQRVAHQPNQHDEAEEEGDQPGVREEGVPSPPHVLVPLHAPPQRQVRLGGVHPEMHAGVPRLLGRVQHGDGGTKGARRWRCGGLSFWEAA